MNKILENGRQNGLHKVYQLMRKDKHGYTEYVWSLDKQCKGWKFTGNVDWSIK